jgi:hypothetical protein
MKKPTKDPTEGQKKNSTKDSKKGEEMGNDKYIRFDWAIKRILRDKANFGVLEGLMTVLLGEPIKIMEILESESNRDSHEDKSNRVDVKAKTSEGEIIIVEVQLAREAHFMHRILYGTSKAVIEQLRSGRTTSTSRRCTPSTCCTSTWATARTMSITARRHSAA